MLVNRNLVPCGKPVHEKGDMPLLPRIEPVEAAAGSNSGVAPTRHGFAGYSAAVGREAPFRGQRATWALRAERAQ